MTTVAYAHDIDETVFFAGKNGVKSGVVKAVHIVVQPAETSPFAPVTIVTYSVEVPNTSRKAGEGATHRESVPETLAAADLDGAWTHYLALLP